MMDTILTFGRDILGVLACVLLVLASIAAAVNKTARAVIATVLITALVVKGVFFSSPKVEGNAVAVEPVTTAPASSAAQETATATFENFDHKGGKSVTVTCSGPVGNVRCVTVK